MPQIATIGNSIIGLDPVAAKRVLNQRVREYNARRRANPQESFCDCGERGYIHKHGQSVCKRCDRLEKLEMQFVLRKSRQLAEAAIVRGIEPRDERLKREAEERREAIEPFESGAENTPHGTVIWGHGHYPLLCEPSLPSVS